VWRWRGKIVQLGHLRRCERRDRGERNNGSPSQSAPVEPKDGFDDVRQMFRNMHVSLITYIKRLFSLLFFL
jgi:hypothetical protein